DVGKVLGLSPRSIAGIQRAVEEGRAVEAGSSADHLLTLALLAQDNGAAPDLNALTFDDPAVYDMISAGDTIGVFQVESRAQTQLTVVPSPTVLEISCVAPISFAHDAQPLQVGRHVILLDAAHGPQALTLLGERPDPIALVISDLVMPFMNVLQLYDALQALQAGVRMLIVTGYPMPHAGRTWHSLQPG
ncbi:MAG TPA: hypothetical protein VK879_07880, partial [Candidatus Sulfomarinibacteraceae bacterium]|nr:hypothetical protein [Candidatus Sulfomarinibacteraceae bacterium]